MQNLEQLKAHLKNLKTKGHKTVTLDVNWLLQQLTSTEYPSTPQSKPSSFDGGKF